MNTRTTQERTRGVRSRCILISILAVMLALSSGIARAGHVEILVAFNPDAGEFPEGIALDKKGNIYVSLIALGQIRKIDPGGAQSVRAEFNLSGFGPAGLALDASGTIFTAVVGLDLQTGETDPATRGVYRVGSNGTPERLSGTGAILFPNDVAFDKRGNLYATDTAAGSMWRIPRGGSAELWFQDSLLEGDGSLGFGFPIGANGIAHRHNRMIVANTERGRLVEIPIEPDGSAGAPTVLAESSSLVGADGIALDVHGSVYVASAQNAVVRVGGGSIDMLATAEDGLNQPSTLAFGTGKRDHKTLFVLNFSIFAPAPTPGVLTLPVGEPGQPLP